MREYHPYGEFFPQKSSVMIVGSFPIAKFSNPKRRLEIGPRDMDFFFGGEKNLLWRLLGDVFNVELRHKDVLINFLTTKEIAIGDVIKSCRRKAGGGSDTSLYDIEWNTDLLKKINEHKIKKVFFTSKKVETWFNKIFPDSDHLEKVTLISPSAQSVRALYQRADFQGWLKEHPHEKKYQFILDTYRQEFALDS